MKVDFRCAHPRREGQRLSTRVYIARQSDALSVDEPEAEAQQYGDTGSDQFVDWEDYVGSQVVAAENYSTSHDIDEGSALAAVPQHPDPPAKNRPRSGPVSEYRANRTRPGRHFPSCTN
ncbi:hypothetical protein QBC37DRAFT_407186 [Rhypophila decipiens]|uniref:Uncharacterized protein n=1 Tax=Rhypophila decipiens TaxID=261697 RepID=A0AAN7AYQ8_9PEZI|nr:hypothetical protein QBC37DRAFT_407186 [Rhypophila decipiens]